MKQSKYILTLNPDFVIDKSQLTFHFDTPEQLYDFIDETLGYDDEQRIKELVQTGGEYLGEDKQSHFTIIIPENIVEKTPFNDVDLFVRDFKSYLIGKRINVGSENQKVEIITDVTVSAATFENVFIGTKNNDLMLNINDFQKFIDGEQVVVKYEKNGNYKNETNIELQLQNENTETSQSLNSTDYKYYVVATRDNKMCIVRGFEYKEDAKTEAIELQQFEPTIKISVVSKKDLMSAGIDPNNNECWQTNARDYDVVKTALNSAVVRDDFSQDKADMYLEAYRQGKYLNVIKAQLLYLHGQQQRQLHNAFIISNIDKINALHQSLTRIEHELMNIIKEEK